jgi:hypothetical protein
MRSIHASILASLVTLLTVDGVLADALTLSCSGTRQAIGNGFRPEEVRGFIIIVDLDQATVLPVGYQQHIGPLILDVPPLVVTSNQRNSFDAKAFFYQRARHGGTGCPG